MCAVQVVQVLKLQWKKRNSETSINSCFVIQKWLSTYGPDAKYRNQWLQWLAIWLYAPSHIFTSCIGNVCHFVASLCHGLNWVGFGEAEISVLPMLQRPSTSGPEGPLRWGSLRMVQGKMSSFHEKSKGVRTELDRIEQNAHREWTSCTILKDIRRWKSWTSVRYSILCCFLCHNDVIILWSRHFRKPAVFTAQKVGIKMIQNVLKWLLKSM